MQNPSYNIEIQNYNNQITRTKSYSTKKATYKIVNLLRNSYHALKTCEGVKDYVSTKKENFENENVYRSLILSDNEENPQLLSFSPPKSVEKTKFLETHDWSDIHINEAIEGTMIQLFYDHRIQSWEIATKNAVGGSYWFFKNQYDETVKRKHTTFYDMFLDALASERDRELNDLQILKQLPKEYCYTFVLQHPENHIVYTVEFAKLYLVAIYKIAESKVEFILPEEYQGWKCFIGNSGIFHFPRTLTADSYDDFEQKYRRIFLENSAQYMGFMLNSRSTGERVSIKNEAYEELKKIRGNHPNLQYQYLSLYRIGKIKEYLAYFPMYKMLFYHFKNEYMRFIKTIHECYCAYYIRKEVDLTTAEISKKYFVHIWRLHHQIYIPSLKTGEKKKITFGIVKQYFDELEPRLQLYYLNYVDKI